MTRKRAIGRFRRSKQGGWEREINTLSIQRAIRLMPNDNRISDNAPAVRVLLGWQHIGDAWDHLSRSEPGREYWRVRIDGPFCPLSAMLFTAAEGMTAQPVRQV